MYGVMGESGLAGRMIAGPKYSAQALRVPVNQGFTGTAQGGTVRQLWGFYQRQPYRVYGRVPMWQVEGQQVDPFYDVRGSGLGYLRVADRPSAAGPSLRLMRPRARTYGDPRSAMVNDEPEGPGPPVYVGNGGGGNGAPASSSEAFDFRKMALPLLAGAVFLYMFGRRRNPWSGGGRYSFIRG